MTNTHFIILIPTIIIIIILIGALSIKDKRSKLPSNQKQSQQQLLIEVQPIIL